MNLNINSNMTTTIAADRRRALVLEADIRRTRKIGRLARRAARSAVQTAAPVNRTLVFRPATTAGPIDGAALLASSELEHASARVA